MLLENQLQKVVATCSLPWHFNVGKQQSGQGPPAASASGTVPFQNDPGSPSGQGSMTVDTPTPRPYARNELRVTTLALSSPGSISLSEEEHRGLPCVPTYNTQATVARGTDATCVAGPTQRRRRRDDTDLDDEDPVNATGKRNVRPRREKRNNTPTGAAGPSAPSASANHSHSHSLTTAAATTPHGVSSSNGSSNSPATSATLSAPQPDPSLHPVRRHRSPTQPVEQAPTLLRAANPRSGPVSGGIEILLEVEDVPTTFPLYAKFGDKVAATVSSTFHPLPRSSSNLHISRFGMSVR